MMTLRKARSSSLLMVHTAYSVLNISVASANSAGFPRDDAGAIHAFVHSRVSNQCGLAVLTGLPLSSPLRMYVDVLIASSSAEVSPKTLVEPL